VVFCKIHEHRHDFMRRPYLKADGMPAQYSPDFILRTETDVCIVETKAQSPFPTRTSCVNNERHRRG
jgi:type III restriction enzyme